MSCLCSQNTITAMIARAKSGTVGARSCNCSGQVGFAGIPECKDMPGYDSAFAAVVEGAKAMCIAKSGSFDPLNPNAYDQCVEAETATMFAQNITPACTAWIASKKKGGGTPGGGGGSVVVKTCPTGQHLEGTACVADAAVDEGWSGWWFVGGAAIIGIAGGVAYAMHRKGKR